MLGEAPARKTALRPGPGRAQGPPHTQTSGHESTALELTQLSQYANTFCALRVVVPRSNCVLGIGLI